MTVAPIRPPRLDFNDVEEVGEALRRQGFRLSTARRVVLDVLFAAEGPVSVEYIAEGLGGRLTRSDLTSVYRNLEWLEGLGVVRHVHLGHGPGLYSLARESDREYLVCERCGQVESVDPAELESVRKQIRRAFGFEARFSHFAIPGLCGRCNQAISSEQSPAPASGSGRTGGRARSERGREQPHAHAEAHSHGHGEHAHPHTETKHKHTNHEHEHSHGDYVHSHSHAHEQGLEQEHGHGH